MKQWTIRIAPAGLAFTVLPGTPLLAGAEAAGITLPSACRNGTCRTCMCRLLDGEVRHLLAWPGLSADEKREGWILPCVAVAHADCVLDAPAAR